MSDDFTEIFEQAVQEVLTKAEGSSFPLRSFPQYASANDVGVQMPGPMSDRTMFEGGFEETGADMAGMPASSFETSVSGVQLPGSTRWEFSFDYGEDFRELAQRQGEPPTNQDFGDTSDMGSAFEAHGDEPSIRVLGRMPASQFDAIAASDILPAFDRLRDKFNSSSAAAGVQGGLIPGASMAGLPLGGGSGVLQGDGYRGDDWDRGSGDGDFDENDWNRYPGGQPLRPEGQDLIGDLPRVGSAS